MHPILEAYVAQFTKEQALEDLPHDQQFARFVNYCVVSKQSPERFELDVVSTQPPESGIDGAAILIGDTIVASPEEAEARFARVRTQTDAQYVFIQSKRSEKFQKAEMLSFGTAVRDLLAASPALPQDDVLQQISAIHKVVIKNANKLRNGQPDCRLYYATSGTLVDGGAGVAYAIRFPPPPFKPCVRISRTRLS